MEELSFGKQYAGELVTIKMDVNGTLSAENPEEVVGIRFFYNDCLNNQRLISISAAALSTTDMWTTVYMNVRLNENGSIWLAAEGRPAMGVYDINVQNISMIEDGRLVTTSKTSGWNGNAVRVSFGEAYANKNVLVSANVAGDISTAASGASIGFGVFADGEKAQHINYVTLDKADLVSLDTFNKTAFVLTLNEKGEAYLAASRTNNAGACGAVTVIFKDIELLDEVDYSGIYDRALSGGGWAGSQFSFDFGADYANKTVKVTMQVAGTAALDGDAKLGFYGYDESGNALGVKYELKREQISSYTDWTEVTFLWTLNEEGKFNTVMAATASTYENYHLFIKDVVCEEVAYTTTSAESGYWNAHESTFVLDFGSQYANKTVCITMNVKGDVSDAYTGPATGFGYYNGDALDSWGGFRPIEKNSLLSGNKDWTTVTVPNITLNKDGQAKFGASNGSDKASIVSGAYTIWVKDVVEAVEAVWGESKTGWYDENGVKNDNNGATLIPINLNDSSIAHGDTITVSMQVKGTASVAVSNGLKASFYVYWWAMNNGDGGFVEVVKGDLDAALRQNEEFKTVVLRIKVTTKGVAYLNCAWATEDSAEAKAAGGYSATVKDIALWVEPECDYKTSTTNWGGVYFELDFSDVAGVEAESTVTFKMDILGEVTADGTTTIGFTSYTTNDSDRVHRGYFAFDSEIRSGEWKTVEITLQLSEAKKIWLSASRTSNSGTAVTFTIYIKNVQFIEVC